MPKWRDKLGKVLSSRTSLPAIILLIMGVVLVALMINSYQAEETLDVLA